MSSSPNQTGKTYTGGNLTPFVILTSFLASTGGLIFGYDIGISGGVTSMPSFQKQFFPKLYNNHRSNKNNYCSFDIQTVTLFTSSLYLSALVAAILASSLTRNFGRKLSILSGGVLFFAGATVNAFAVSFSMLILGRLLLGFGVGFVNQSVPLYLSEMAPYKHRGALNSGFQMCITVGILIANVLNYVFSKIRGGWGWRLSLGGAVVPALIITIASTFIPETPNSLIQRGRHEKAKSELQKIRGVVHVDDELTDLVLAGEVSKRVENPWRKLLERKYRPHLTMAVLIPLFQQLTGINAIMFYAPIMLKTIGFGDDASLISAVITGSINVISTMVSIYGVDRWGRRFLFLQGGTQMFICQVGVALCMGGKLEMDEKVGERWYAWVMVMFICIYVAGFAWSWGPLGWLVPTEIFPLEIRSAAQSLTVAVNMWLTFVVAELFMIMLCHLKFMLFLFFAGFLAVMIGFVYGFLPETKGVPIEDMGRVWVDHWFWSRFVKNVVEDDKNSKIVLVC